MGFSKKWGYFLGAILPFSLFSCNLAAQDGGMRLANATSVYHDIIASLNERGTIRIQPTNTFALPKREPEPKVVSRKIVQNNLEEETRQFIEEIRFEILESVKFPSSLKGKGYRSKVLIEFDLNPDGTLRNLKARAEVGPAQNVFEARALSAVMKASRYFPLVPDQVDVKTLKFKIPILFEEA